MGVTSVFGDSSKNRSRIEETTSLYIFKEAINEGDKLFIANSLLCLAASLADRYTITSMTHEGNYIYN